MRAAILTATLLLAPIVTNADSPPAAPQVKHAATTRKLFFDWDDVAGASYYRLMYSVGSGAYRPAIDNLPAETSRAMLSVPVHLASRASLRYTIAACNTSGCARSNGLSPHFKLSSVSYAMCGTGAVFAMGNVDGSRIDGSPATQVCLERVAARFYPRRRFR